MSKYDDTVFFTDPHIGKVLVSNTTPASRKRLTQRLTDAAMEQVRKPGYKVCGGDLFDKFDNPAKVVRDGVAVAEGCHLVLGGNHDVENSLDSYSSLALVDGFGRATEDGSNIVMPEYNKSVEYAGNAGGVWITAVPHHSTQQLFDEMLGRMCDGEYLNKGDVLLLHCNYDCDMATNDTSLNLTRDMAARLLQNFKFIMIGHDHNPKKDFDGRLIVMGSVHPTCFGDCHVDHKVYTLNGGVMTEEVVWSAAEKYMELAVDERLPDWEPLQEGYEFVRITGRMTPEQVPELAKWVRDAWRRESVFAIRVDAVVVANREDAADTALTAKVSFKDMLTNKLVDSPELREVWELVTGEMGDAE